MCGLFEPLRAQTKLGRFRPSLVPAELSGSIHWREYYLWIWIAFKCKVGFQSKVRTRGISAGHEEREFISLTMGQAEAAQIDALLGQSVESAKIDGEFVIDKD